MRIEDHERIESDPPKGTGQTRGRKPAPESRATEFRQTLIKWKQTPESSRPSLRALARALGTSHQLLQHYLDGLEKWRCMERYRTAQLEPDQIVARAILEDRPMTQWEEERCHACAITTIRAMAGSVAFDTLEDLKREAKRGPLNQRQFKMLRLVAQHFPEAQELLRKCSQRKFTPEELRALQERRSKGYRKDFERGWAKYISSPHPPSESEKPRLARRYERWRARLEGKVPEHARA